MSPKGTMRGGDEEADKKEGEVSLRNEAYEAEERKEREDDDREDRVEFAMNRQGKGTSEAFTTSKTRSSGDEPIDQHRHLKRTASTKDLRRMNKRYDLEAESAYSQSTGTLADVVCSRSLIDFADESFETSYLEAGSQRQQSSGIPMDVEVATGKAVDIPQRCYVDQVQRMSEKGPIEKDMDMFGSGLPEQKL
ncbi:MAG: hypothetical protein Q9168_007405 [Polycauliona sp. 1 TL-2023]